MTEITHVLGALDLGPQTSIELQSRLGVSQPTLSRMLSRDRADIATLGRGRSTRYARYRRIRELPPELPAHRISRTGEPLRIGTVLTIAPERYWYEDRENPKASGEHRAIPWFATDMRPQGYLGRLFPQMHHDLGLPDRIGDWSEDQSLYAIARRGEDIVGNLLIGEESLARWLALPKELAVIETNQRGAHYEALASRTLEGGIPGSSAAGEQPKFTAVVRGAASAAQHVLVKFSTSQRWSDLLLAEHLASVVLREANRPSVETDFIQSGMRTFLEVVRFDRNGARGRTGIVSLGALDDQFVGDRRAWPESAAALLRAGVIRDEDAMTIRFLSAFGTLIGNTDMHFGNISFLTDGHMDFRLAPSYDMLPMLYAPLQGELLHRDFIPPKPRPGHADQWLAALPVAQEFWQRLSRDGRASAEFRSIAGINTARVGQLAA